MRKAETGGSDPLSVGDGDFYAEDGKLTDIRRKL